MVELKIWHGLYQPISRADPVVKCVPPTCTSLTSVFNSMLVVGRFSNAAFPPVACRFLFPTLTSLRGLIASNAMRSNFQESFIQNAVSLRPLTDYIQA